MYIWLAIGFNQVIAASIRSVPLLLRVQIRSLKLRARKNSPSYIKAYSELLVSVRAISEMDALSELLHIITSTGVAKVQQIMAYLKRSRTRCITRIREEKTSALLALPLVVGFTASKATGSTNPASPHPPLGIYHFKMIY